MTTATPLLGMDDNMGLGTPNFFSSAWNPEQNDFSFTEAFAGNLSGYTPQLLQGQAEDNQLDYFSGQGDDQFGSQSIYQPRQPSGLSQPHADLDRILGNPAPAFLDKNIGAANSISIFNPSNHATQMEDLSSYQNPSYNSTGLGVPSFNGWAADIKPTASPARIMNQMDNDTGRRTSLRYGQITPVDSPPDDSLPPAQKAARQSSTKNRGDDRTQSNDTPKVKKPRKSKKKPMTKEQEESKRKKFLERNRVAADKCRQNRKKWIDDLQTKAHYFGTDNTTKKAQLEELEQEIVQLRSLLFIHSRSCNQRDIASWVEREASKVQLFGEPDSKETLEDNLSIFGQSVEEASSPTSRPTSSHGYRSVSEALSRRYSDATAGDDFTSVGSVQSSRRPSTTV
jgi:hypothetical protein